MSHIKNASKVALMSVVLLGQASAASEWNLRRNSGNGACSVQPADRPVQLGEFLAKHPTRKTACEDARSRHTEDALDKTKCSNYTINTAEQCKADGIPLLAPLTGAAVEATPS